MADSFQYADDLGPFKNPKSRWIVDNPQRTVTGNFKIREIALEKMKKMKQVTA